MRSVAEKQRSSYYKKGVIVASKVKTICEEKVVPIIEELGYEVVEVEYVKKSDGMNLTFYIDKDEGIIIDDCEKVSKAIDDLLEELDPTEGVAYILNVSSPGIDRPIKTNRDFERNLQKEISITLFSKLNGLKKFEGILVAYSDEDVSIDNKGQIITIKRELIAHVVPVVKF